MNMAIIYENTTIFYINFAFVITIITIVRIITYKRFTTGFMTTKIYYVKYYGY